MFDFFRRHTRVLQFILLLLIVPSFVVFGIQGYDQFSEGKDEVAKVDGQAITRAEWDQAHRNQVERLRTQMPNVDVKLLDTPEVRQRVLDDLIRQRVLFAAARDLHLTPTDDRLKRLFETDPQFANLRNPDGTVRKELLAAQGMNSQIFAARLGQDMALSQVLSGVGGTAVVPAAVARTAVDAFYQRRDVRVQTFAAKDYLAKADASDAELQAYYDDPRHAARLQAPESVSFEYLVLDLATVARSLSVAEDDLRKYYSENASRYEQPQERRARHILIKVDAGAPADAKAKAKARAETLLAEARKNPAGFADLARAQSEDPGSAKQGGDLDWFVRGAMVKPFEDAAFALKKGEISGVVESDFGFHILQLDDLRGGDKRSFESVRPEIEDEVRKSLAQKRYAEAAEQFSNLAEQEDTLQPVADKLKLTVQRAERFVRGVQAEPGSVLANPKVAEVAFLADNLRSKRNALAVEIGANQLLSLRVTEHQPSRKQALAEVREQVKAGVLQAKAAKAAREEGASKLAQWKTQPAAAGTLPAAVTLSRVKTQNLPRAVVEAVLKAKADALPAWIGVDLGDEGYAVAVIEKVQAADLAEAGSLDKARAQVTQMWAQAESEAYYAALRKRYKAVVLDSAKAVSGDDAAASAPAGASGSTK
jgi:peptidyl-prolyl cis-trans isomerase D